MMNTLFPNSKEICDVLLRQEMSLDFIKNAATNITPKTLAEVVQCLKEQGKCPAHLKEILSSSPFPVFDIVGTGGTGTKRLNTSTLVSFFAGNFGINIIKHGGKSSSRKIGSVDFMENLGISLEQVYNNAKEYFRATGLLFLAASYTYPIFSQSAPLRKQIPHPTLFNLLGPLLNPAPVQGKLIGAYDEHVAKIIAETCKILNQSAIVVTSLDGEGYLDEASPFGKNILYFCKDNFIFPVEIEALETLNFSRCEFFTDSIKITKQFLALEKTSATDYIQKLLAFNIATLLCLNEFTATTTLDMSDFLNQVPNKIIKLYYLILSNFDSHLLAAKKRMEQFVSLQTLHEKSPIQVKNNLTLKKIEDIHNHQQKCENFFTKEKLLIAEIKLSRPQENFTNSLSLEERIKSYQNADAISIVTHPSFSGSLDLLKKIRSLTTKPILAKDFIRTPTEIIALKNAGANGILLLQDFLEKEELYELVQYCKNIGVASFVESSFVVPTLGDFHVLNSRSLHSLEENKSYRNFILNSSLNHPNKEKIILASSLKDPYQIQFALSRFKGCLVGSALMEQGDKIKIQHFIDQGKKNEFLIKFCGARTIEDLELALSFSINFIGINLIPASKRYIGTEKLSLLLPYIEKIQEKICFITRFDAAPQCLQMVSHLNCIEQAYSAPLLPNRSGLFFSGYVKYMGTDAILLDGKHPGSGVAEKFPNNHNQENTPTFMSGGIDPTNIFGRIYEAKQKGWNVIGIDCASAICHEDLAKQPNSFSRKKIVSLLSKLKREST